MDRNQVRVALLKITVCVLCATTWIFSSFIFASRPERADRHYASNAFADLVRLPASLPAALPEMVPAFAPQVKTAAPVQMNVFTLPCWDKKDALIKDTSARWVRLTGKACQLAPAEGTVTVRNLSNGYMATVFDAQPGDMTTDFIPLQSGKNDILIRFESEPGVALESQFTFMRE